MAWHKFVLPLLQNLHSPHSGLRHTRPVSPTRRQVTSMALVHVERDDVVTRLHARYALAHTLHKASAFMAQDRREDTFLQVG